MAVAAVCAQSVPVTEVDTSAGGALYQANCLACHQVTGDGITAAFPPLREHVPSLLQAEGGREYLLAVILFGLTGEITVTGRTYSGLMPSWSHLSDGQLADVVNYVATAWGNGELLPRDYPAVTADDVAHARMGALDPGRVHELRRALQLD